MSSTNSAPFRLPTPTLVIEHEGYEVGFTFTDRQQVVDELVRLALPVVEAAEQAEAEVEVEAA